MEFDSFPGYSGSIVQLAWGILNRYGLCAPGPVPPALARHFAHPPRNTVLFLLDGLGVNILEKHLPPDSFLRRNQTVMLRSAHHGGGCHRTGNRALPLPKRLAGVEHLLAAHRQKCGPVSQHR